jgi:hypothetical protein
MGVIERKAVIVEEIVFVLLSGFDHDHVPRTRTANRASRDRRFFKRALHEQRRHHSLSLLFQMSAVSDRR